jgi:hypothetical protein
VLEQELEIRAHARGNEVRLSGAEQSVRVARKVLQELYAQVRLGNAVQARDVREAVRMVTRAPDVDLGEVYEDVLAAVGSRRRIAAKNLSQRRYIELMRDRDLVIAVGPAGTGKTYLAMAMAVAALNRHEVSRIILTRPAVEAGEKLGFLPGTMAEKVNPYLRPLYDALHDMMSFEKAARLMDRGSIEVAPLAFMREHDQRADEDVPHASRVQRQGRRDRRRDPDRPSGRQVERTGGGGAGPGWGRGHRPDAFHRVGRRAPSPGPVDSPRLRQARAQGGWRGRAR